MSLFECFWASTTVWDGILDMDMDDIDLNEGFSEKEVQEIIDWIESLDLVELSKLREYWLQCQKNAKNLQ